MTQGFDRPMAHFEIAPIFAHVMVSYTISRVYNLGNKCYKDFEHIVLSTYVYIIYVVFFKK